MSHVPLAKLKRKQGIKVRIKRGLVIDQPPKPVSSPNSSDHMEEIKELGFKYSRFLAQFTLPPIFVDYKPATVIAKFWEKLAIKEKKLNVGLS